jgi:S-(hydroxymethyl)glutathione dehydrogenase / alcohol dehydrogenase
VMGSYYGTARPHVDIPRFLNLYKSGKLKLDELVSRTYPLEEVNTAFEALGTGEVARSVLVFE